jgi:Metal-sensitive transcriptional repressor
MIENEDYCVDIITLSLAVQKSLGSLSKLLVENHLRTHDRAAPDDLRFSRRVSESDPVPPPRPTRPRRRCRCGSYRTPDGR